MELRLASSLLDNHRNVQSLALMPMTYEVRKSVKNPMDEYRVLQIAKVLGDPVRFSIYRHILETDEVRCGDICVETPVRASTTSHHLKMLSDAGLIESRREGQGVYYRSVPSTLRSFVGFLQALPNKEAPQDTQTSKRKTAARSQRERRGVQG